MQGLSQGCSADIQALRELNLLQWEIRVRRRRYNDPKQLAESRICKSQAVPLKSETR